MKRISLLILLLTFTLAALAQTKPDITLKLYPDGQEAGTGIAGGPGESNGLPGPTKEVRPQVYEEITDPFINIYLPKKCNGQMIIVCPGGGYKRVCSYHEGEKVAAWALERGIAVCVLIYRLPNGHCKVPLTDLQNAFRYCRRNASKWGVRQIGVMGFSAGGHLAASASTLYTDNETRPDFSILIYPVVSFVVSPHSSSRKYLIGADPDPAMTDYYSLEKRVTPFTPVTFLALSRDDKSVNPINSLIYYEALLRNSVSAELHIYTSGGHGWGFGSRSSADTDRLGVQRKDFDAALGRWLEQVAADN